MAKKEKIGKNKVLIETPSGTVLEGSPDLEGLAKLYADWQSAISSVGKEDLFMVNKVNLFQMFLQQGVSGRTMGNPSPANRGEGGVKIDSIIRNIIDGGEIEISEIDELTKLKQLMDEYSKPNNQNNPRNIVFTDKEVDTDSGKVVVEEEMFGHYRTPNYEEKRDVKNKLREKRNLPALPRMPACPESWYNEIKGEAEPPFWQVIYGRGSEVKIAETKSLHEIVEQALEELEKPMGTTQENPIVLGKKGQTGWAKKALEIPRIKRVILQYIEPSKANNNGNFRHKEVRDIILNQEFRIPNNKNFRDKVRGTLGIPENLTVNRAYFSISRGIINQMAALVMDEKNMRYEKPKTGRQDNTLKITNFSEEKKTSFNQPVRSWADILKVAEC